MKIKLIAFLTFLFASICGVANADELVSQRVNGAPNIFTASPQCQWQSTNGSWFAGNTNAPQYFLVCDGKYAAYHVQSFNSPSCFMGQVDSGYYVVAPNNSCQNFSVYKKSVPATPVCGVNWTANFSGTAGLGELGARCSASPGCTLSTRITNNNPLSGSATCR